MLRAQHSFKLLSASFLLPGRSLLLPRRPYFSTPLCLAKRKSRKASAPLKSIPPARPTSQNGDSASHPVPAPEEDLRRSPTSNRRDQVLFVGSVGLGVFLWAAVKTNTETNQLVEKIVQVRGTDGLNNRTLLQAKIFELRETLSSWGALVAQKTESLPEIPRTTIRQLYADAAQKYINTSDVVKICWGICAFNGAVFLAWKVPRLTGFMYRNFVHRPLSGKSLTLLTSVFSHESFIHLLFNSMALTSFAATTGYYLSTEQAAGGSNRLESTAGYHFLAFFITAGLFSSLASHVLRNRLYDQFLARISRVGKAGGVLPHIGGSLGASGAIYATVTLTALAFPSIYVSPIFLPISIPIQIGVCGMILLDVVGFVRGWRMLDHFAHLGGAVFGAVYYHCGPRLWDLCRAFTGYLFDDL
ncbi:hypothetical protein B0H17DRAFT_1087787 [Mycena rosella]|uniref:Peptidase S54 rhomboid domain-containing protein n=1 Tax=Mycena rosella TaxID=1033263 RepID=A0AAD7CX61_MYCRO|nr:hypothetical protein B0H17DRAFT_1087787 [Mycena rosella]